MACPPAPSILRFILELLHPDEWGKHRMIDMPHNSGVLDVGYSVKKPEYSPAASVKSRKGKSCSRRIRFPRISERHYWVGAQTLP
jgi:hypothetical protein